MAGATETMTWTTPGVAAVTAAARRVVPTEGVITDRTRLRILRVCDGLAH